MSFNPEQSAIKVDAELEAALKNASHDQIKSVMADAAVRQGLATRDIYDPSVLLTVEPRTAPKRFAQTIEIAGMGKKIFEGDSELDVTRQVNAYMREQFSQPSTTQTETARDSATGRFVSQDADAAQQKLAAKVELELRFKRGEVSASEYLAQSGAVDEYLASRGIDMDALKSTSDKTYEANWQSSTEAFLARHPEWEGGTQNLQSMGEALQAMGLTENPTVESLEAAYVHLKANNKIVPNEEVELNNKIANAKSPEELRTLLGRQSSTLWR